MSKQIKNERPDWGKLVLQAQQERPDELTEDEAQLITTKINLPSGYLSPTQIDAYLKCPIIYQRRYCFKDKFAPSVPMIEGTTLHETMRYINEHKRDTGRDPAVKKSIERFRDLWTDKQKEIDSWEKDKPATITKRCTALIRAYSRDFAPNFSASVIEQPFASMIGPIPMVGIIDAAGTRTIPRVLTKTKKQDEKKRSIIDYKTANRLKSTADLDGSVQLSLYQHIVVEPDEVGICALLKPKGEVVFQPGIVSAARVKWFRRVVLMVANSISMGSFPPTDPASWVCSPKWCGHYANCRGQWDNE